MTDKFVALAADNEQALNWAEDSSDDRICVLCLLMVRE